MVLRNFGHALLAEPRVPNAPRRVWRDWVLVSALVPMAVLEGVLRDDVGWRPVSLVVAVSLVFTLLWRRTNPLAMVALAFGSFVVLDILSLIVSAGPVGLYTMAFVLVLAYALARWGAGRELVIGLGIMLLAALLGTVVDFTGVVDAVAGTLFLLFPVSLGISVRYWTSTRLRELDQVKLRERAQLARELHDTVGHHVSAIAIRAQAGQLSASPTRPQPWTLSGSSSARHPARWRRCGSSSAVCETASPPPSRRSPAWPTSRTSRTGDGPPRSTSTARATSMTWRHRSTPPSIASPRSP